VATTVGLAPDVVYTLGADSVALDIDTLGLEISWTETHDCLFVKNARCYASSKELGCRSTNRQAWSAAT
jgi:hypothetical protein